MRLKGYSGEFIRDYRKITLDRPDGTPPVMLTVHALPSTFMDEAELEIPSPTPPKLGVSRNKKGRIDRDAVSGRPLILYDEQDPDYLREVAKVRVLQTFKMIIDALDPDEIEFEADKPSMTPRAYYEACRKEMDAFGFSLGDYNALMQAVSDLTGVSEEDMQLAESDFFKRARLPSDSLNTKSVKPWGGTTGAGLGSVESIEPDG